jgi:predicted Rossmann fold flavoprotein
LVKDNLVTVIGGGPAGLFCAGQIARRSPDTQVVLLEKMKAPGRKLLITGAGECNLTNSAPIEEFVTAYGGNGRFLKHALYSFPPEKLLQFFSDRGLTFYTDPNGKYFPETGRAQGILRALTDFCDEGGVSVHTSEAVHSVERNDNFFTISTDKQNYTTRHVVLATGGKSYPATGSSGDGYLIAESLGHLIIQPTEALSPLIISGFPFKNCAGVSFKDIVLSVKKSGSRLKAKEKGDLLITHNGLSGPAALHLSRVIEKEDVVSIDLLPMRMQNEDETLQKIDSLIRRNPQKMVKHCLSELVDGTRFFQVLLKELNIPPEQTGQSMSIKNQKKLSHSLHNLEFEVSEKGSYDSAMVTAGGINLREIESRNFESKLVKNLYCIGETIDIDGNSGGYNLQAAFSTAFCAAQAIVKKIGEHPKPD